VTLEIGAEWLALNRGLDGTVVKSPEGIYVYSRSPVSEYLAQACDRPIGKGLLRLAEPSSDDARWVEITAAGRQRYAVLCHGERHIGNGSGS
jgi:hypothetical protein